MGLRIEESVLKLLGLVYRLLNYTELVLGRILSEQITRRVILGVLAIMFVKPLIEITDVDNTHVTGLEQLFWFGRSACGDGGLQGNSVALCANDGPNQGGKVI